MTTVSERRVTDLDLRATMLRCIAEKWDQTIFDHDDRYGHTAVRTVTRTLEDSAMEYAHPLLPRETIREWLEALRDATNALRDYELNGISPVDDEDLAGYSDNMILNLLNQDIDDALYPLLHGTTPGNACFECRRTHANVTTWRERLAGSSRCEAHQ